MITQYIDMYLNNVSLGAKEIKVDGDSIDDYTIATIAKSTDGYSGREISKLAIAWQAAAYGSEGASIDKDLMMIVLDESNETKLAKRSWLSDDEISRITNDQKPT